MGGREEWGGGMCTSMSPLGRAEPLATSTTRYLPPRPFLCLFLNVYADEDHVKIFFTTKTQAYSPFLAHRGAELVQLVPSDFAVLGEEQTEQGGRR